MKHTLLASAVFAAITLSACDKPTVVTVPVPTPAPTPPTTVVVPGPQGAPGATGAPGADGAKGEPGKPGDSTTVIVTPPPTAPRK